MTLTLNDTINQVTPLPSAYVERLAENNSKNDNLTIKEPILNKNKKRNRKALIRNNHCKSDVNEYNQIH